MVLQMFSAPVGATGHALIAQTAPVPQTAIVRGTVTNAAGDPLQYAVVSIPTLDVQQFTNAAGKFVFTGLNPGTYRLTARQLGFTAAAVEVTLAAGQNLEISVRMERIVTKLAIMQVLADAPCKNPGRPTANGNAELAQVFEQLEQNALRMRLLSAVYPYDALVERTRFTRHRDGLETIESRDSVRAPNQQKARYKPGEVVVERLGMPLPGAKGRATFPRETFMQLPTLLDFADVVFQQNHCFYLIGIGEGTSGKEVRVDFKAADQLKSPDVSGSVFLESDSYRLLRADIGLTKIPKTLPGLKRVQALTYFDELAPGLPNVGEIIATSDLDSVTPLSPAQSVERIVTLKILFNKEIPEPARRDTINTTGRR